MHKNSKFCTQISDSKNYTVSKSFSKFATMVAFFVFAVHLCVSNLGFIKAKNLWNIFSMAFFETINVQKYQ